MEYFENLAINSTTKKPTIWLRYVDDTFVIWRHGKEQLKGFLEHLNSIKDNIKFTMEEEKQGQLPFLDVLVERVSQQFHTSVFRKPTHTDSYIHYNSNHHPSTKIGTILCLKKRAEHLCKGQSLQRELEHIRTTFIANSYPEGLVRRTLKKKKRRNDDLIKEGERVLCLPYIKGLSETLQRVCRPLEVRIRHKATNTLRSLLTRIKTPHRSHL